MTLNKVKVDRTFGQKYKKGLISTKRIENYPMWMTNTFDEADKLRKWWKQDYKEKYLEFCRKNINPLIESRVDEFKELWGKQDFVYRYEYNMYSWVVEHNGCMAVILSEMEEELM